jgi:hypothetical protein
MTMNSSTYMSVLGEKLFPWVTIHRVRRFLQDGAPCRKRKISMALLRKQPFTVVDSQETREIHLI